MSRYLFVIDYQNDFVDGALGFPGAEKLVFGMDVTGPATAAVLPERAKER